MNTKYILLSLKIAALQKVLNIAIDRINIEMEKPGVDQELLAAQANQLRRALIVCGRGQKIIEEQIMSKPHSLPTDLPPITAEEISNTNIDELIEQFKDVD